MTEMEEIKMMLADMNKKLDKVIFQNKLALYTKYGSPIKQDKEEKKTMTKNEQIEEMAIDIAKSDCSLWEHCPKNPKHNCISQNPEIMLESSKNYVTIATWLVNAGYRKIDDDYFDVITKDELKQYKAQAVKEFAEKLKSGLGNCTGCYIPDCFESPTDEFAYSEKDLLKLICELLKEDEK